MSESQDSRKRSKRHYGKYGAKKYKGSRELEAGMQGILMTCNMDERKCISEAYSLLNEYADQLYGPEKFSDVENSDSDGDNAADEDDAEAALKKEVKQIRSSTQKMERRFQALDSGASNVIFIRTQHIDPDKLVHHILQDLHATKKKKSRVILRMLPVSGSCKAFINDMEKYLENFLEPWFKTPNQGTFQIVFKARYNSSQKREEVIRVLAALVAKMNPQNKVDLTNPEYTLIIEVIKNVCCVSVVRDYMLFRKFNVQEVSKLEEQKLPQKTEGSPKEDVKQDGGAGDCVPGQEVPEKQAVSGKTSEEAGQDHSPGQKTERSPKESVIQEVEDVKQDGGAGDCVPGQEVPEKQAVSGKK